MIKPTIGRKVWYRPSNFDKLGPDAMQTAGAQPLDATVIAVWGDRMVNLLVTDIVGKQFPKLSTTLVQSGDALPMQGPPSADGSPMPGGYAEWMTHQLGHVVPTPTQPPVDNAFVAPGCEQFGQHPVLAGVQAMNAPA